VALPPRRDDGAPGVLPPTQAERVSDLRRVDPVVRAKARVLAEDDHALEQRGDVLQGGRLDGWTVGTFQPSAIPTFRPPFSHHRRLARPVIPPPTGRRPHAEQPHEFRADNPYPQPARVPRFRFLPVL